MGGFFNPSSFYGNQENDYSRAGMQVPDFFRMYQDYGGRTPNSDISNYYRPEDFARLNEVTTKDSGASQLLENYYNSMPTQEQYKPGIGRKIAGFLLGTLGGSGYAGARNFVEEPYSNAVQEWKMQSPGISQRAKNLETAQGREIKGTEFDIRQRIAAEKAKNTDIRGGNNLAANLTRGTVTDQNADLARAEKTRVDNERLKDADDRRNLMATLTANARADRLARDKEVTDREKITAITLKQKQMELDSDNEEQAINKAGEYVQGLVGRHPAFAGKKIFDPMTGEFSKSANPADIEQVKSLIKFYAKKILAGEKVQ